MKELVTHLVAAFLAVAAFWWRVSSPQKLWTPERATFLLASAVAALWNLYVAGF